MRPTGTRSHAQYKPQIKLHTQHAPKQVYRKLTLEEILDLLEKARAEYGEAHALRLLEEAIEAMRRRCE